MPKKGSKLILDKRVRLCPLRPQEGDPLDFSVIEIPCSGTFPDANTLLIDHRSIALPPLTKFQFIWRRLRLVVITYPPVSVVVLSAPRGPARISKSFIIIERTLVFFAFRLRSKDSVKVAFNLRF